MIRVKGRSGQSRAEGGAEGFWTSCVQGRVQAAVCLGAEGGGAGCGRQGPGPRGFLSSERGAWSKSGRAFTRINLTVSQECPLDLCNVSFSQ